MAKSVNLNSTRITEIVMSRNGSATIRVSGWLLDDLGNPIKYDSLTSQWQDLPANIKTLLNDAFKPISRIFNNQMVNEDTETWTDLSV